MKILVALDGSQQSEAVLGPAVKLATAAQAEVVLIHVVNPWVDVTPELAPTRDEAIQRVIEQRRAYLAEQAKVFAPRPVQLRVEELQRREDVAHHIAQVAQEQAADILVVASKRTSGLSGLVLGSTAQALLQISPCPVLIVRPQLAS